ncbi:MAG: glycosyltransferase family 2 protein [Acidimicrobiales bacterium]|jgi:hypothetical protein
MRLFRSVVRPVITIGISHRRARRRQADDHQPDALHTQIVPHGEGTQHPANTHDGGTSSSTAREDGPLVSVLVPSWNFFNFIGDCLESIVSQSYRPLEIVIVDDATSDGSYGVAKEFSARDDRIVLHRNDQNVGAFENSLRLLELASGPIVMFVGADDVLHRDAVARLVEGLEQAPDVVLSFGHFDLIGEEGQVIDDRAAALDRWPSLTPIPGIELGDGMLRRCRNWIGSPTAVAFRASALKDPRQLPGSEPGRQPNFDVLWWMRILSEGRAVYARETLSHRREHPSSTTQSVGALVKLLDSWCGILHHAQALGFLADPAAAQEAWASYLILMCLTLAKRDARRGAMRFARAMVSDARAACKELDAVGRARTDAYVDSP